MPRPRRRPTGRPNERPEGSPEGQPPRTSVASSPEPAPERPAEARPPEGRRTRAPAERRTPRPPRSPRPAARPAQERQRQERKPERAARPAQERPAQERAARPAQERPAQERAARPTQERAARPTQERPAQERAARPAQERPVQERPARPAKERAARRAQERPAQERPARPAQERRARPGRPGRPARPAQERPAQEQGARPAQERPAQERGVRPAQERPAQEGRAERRLDRRPPRLPLERRPDRRPPRQPLERRPERLPADGIKAKSQQGAFGESWWARRWINVLEGFGFGGRLARGRSYARGGAVLEINIGHGQVTARVQGSLPRPYQVKISLAPLSDAQWAAVIEAMSEQAIFAAKLLAGEMPQEIEQAFAAARVPLFPRNSRDLTTTCSCPDKANPCKHIAAVYYLLGERFDEDPFLLFELRGRNKEQIGAALRSRRADTTEPDDEPVPVHAERPPALSDLLGHYDEPGLPLEQIAPQIAAPAVEAALLRRYGTPPAEVEDGLRAAYQTVTRAALNRLLGDE